MIKKLIPILGFVVLTGVFFWQVFLKGLMPIASDTVVGLYYPYRDIYAKSNPNGTPFKNFLITDPVRQHYPWKKLSINSYKNLNLPTWNPYSFSGTPNLANFQSAVFYPFNLLFLISKFNIAWSILIMLQPLLAGIFMYFYLKNLKLDEYSSFFGGIIFSFSGFFAMWLEWGTVLHSALWLPLILLCIDKISLYINDEQKISIFKYKFSKYFVWAGVLVFSYISSFFAGHLQTFFYIFIFSFIYSIIRIYQSNKRIKFVSTFIFVFIPILIITLVQSIPTLNFILLSARNLDQSVWQKEGWFLPFKHLIQFIIPDFFGNPSTLNYWGTWNYGELTGFVGIVGLILALYAALFRRDKKTYLLIVSILISLMISLPNPIAKLPFLFNFPFISTSQPTRILFITDFSLSILAALGLNLFIQKGKLKQILISIFLIGFLFLTSFIFLNINSDINLINKLVARRNLFVPLSVFLVTSLILIFHLIFKKKTKNFFILVLILISVLELFRFSWKFNAFSKSEYLYPENKIIKYLENNSGNYRFATSDTRIMPPNFSIIHNLNSVEGYDPLYLQRYAELVSAINRNKPDISSPYGFNRIVRIENLNSNLVDLLGVKYVLSINDLNIKGFEKVIQEGQTSIYENKEVLPRAFFVEKLLSAKNKNEAISFMFDKNFNPLNEAVIEEKVLINPKFGNVKISNYSDNKVELITENENTGFLVLTDSYYPTWHVKINGQEQKIYVTDFNFRGVIVPKGKNKVVFENKLL